MKKLIALLFLLNSSFLFSQFNSLIFQKHLYPYKYGVVALGDQNSDGCDDILIYDCNENKVSIFFGGSPMDTIPELEIVLRDVYNFFDITSMDLNLDGFQDIILSYLDTSVVSSKVQIYYGGNELDNIPDIEFHGPTFTTSFGGLIPVKDFNGDGIEELFIWDPYIRPQGPGNGNFFIYNAAIEFDTIPYKVIRGDTLLNERLYGLDATTGDLDGDGLTDIAITGEIYPTDSFIKFYKGNSEWNTEPFITYYKNEHTFDPTGMRIIEDINGDGKDDILIYSYGEFYPYYYLNSILYGNIPIDTIPDIGLNTQNVGIYNNMSPGDVNGDGYNDLLAGAGLPEQARLWVGGNPMPEVPKQYYGGTYEGYGRLIAKVGDVNGDGLNDICVGQSRTACLAGFVLIFAGDTLYQQPVSVDDINYSTGSYYLSEAYPNHFNPVTNLRFNISQSGLVIIKVYDVLGKEVALLLNKEKLLGEYEFEIDAAKYNLSSGVYFIQMQVLTGSSRIFQSTKKIVLIK